MDGLNLIGNRFICNIAQSENLPGGLIAVNRDPRKQRLKPDAYVGIVEDVGPRCRFVEKGKKVVVRRWIYGQHDVDDERIIAREHQILMLDDRLPYPGVIVLKITQDIPKTSIIVPDTVKDARKKVYSYHGRVIVSGDSDFDTGDLLWVEKRDSGQFFLGNDVLIFKNEPDHLNGELPVLMKAERVQAPVLEVV